MNFPAGKIGFTPPDSGFGQGNMAVDILPEGHWQWEARTLRGSGGMLVYVAALSPEWPPRYYIGCLRVRSMPCAPGVC